MRLDAPLTDTELDVLAGLVLFFPARVFDAHAHLWRRSECAFPPGMKIPLSGDGTIAAWRESQAKIFGDRLRGGLFLFEPRMNPDLFGEFLLAELAAEPDCRGGVFVGPGSNESAVRALCGNPQVVALKPYHAFSTERPTGESSIAGFLPEWAWRLADERRLAVVLHLVKARALNDPQNQAEIRAMCARYSNAKLVLAHAGRGFHGPNTVRGLAALRGLDNLYFDTAAVCEAAPLVAVLEEFGPRKLLFGSDFWISEMRGRPVTAGDGFLWLTDDNTDWERLDPPCRPLRVGLEALRALKEAADVVGLDGADLADVFQDNAADLFGVERRPREITKRLYERARTLIPGGTQLLSKRPEMLAPGRWPAYFREARGCEVWDLDGRRYVDFATNGLGACPLGYRDPDVTRAVRRRLALGSMSTLNPPEEVELAETLLDIHPWAERARFARSGGEAMAVAVRIARATTDRSVVAVCGYCGWHDWYLAANLGESDALRGHLLPGLQPLGVPRELRGTTRTFHYGDLAEFRSVLDDCGSRLAAVVMEPCRYHDPEAGFLEEIAARTRSAGALLVFDEITIGWRLAHGGAHLRFGVAPDIAAFAKALGNGHPMAAVIGTAAAMEGAHASFISSTYWTESVGPAAALAAVKKMGRIGLPAKLAEAGTRVRELWKNAAARHGLPVVSDDGYPCLAHFRFDHELGNELRTLYTRLMLDRGYLAAVQFYPTLAHTEEVIEAFGRALDGVFAEIAAALARGDVKERLGGPAAHTGFSRLL